MLTRYAQAWDARDWATIDATWDALLKARDLDTLNAIIASARF